MFFQCQRDGWVVDEQAGRADQATANERIDVCVISSPQLPTSSLSLCLAHFGCFLLICVQP